MRFNIASLDRCKLIQALYVYAICTTVSPDEQNTLRHAGKPVEALSMEYCSKIIYERSWSTFNVDYLNGRSLTIGRDLYYGVDYLVPIPVCSSCAAIEPDDGTGPGFIEFTLDV